MPTEQEKGSAKEKKWDLLGTFKCDTYMFLVCLSMQQNQCGPAFRSQEIPIGY